MHTSRTLTFKMGTLTIIVAGILTIGVFVFLLVMNYISLVHLQQSTLEHLKGDAEKRAMAISYFFSERKCDLIDISDNKALSTYFENKALGM